MSTTEAQILDGKKVSQKRLSLLQEKVSTMKSKIGKVPGLAVVRVGEDPASKIYVSKKIKTCQETGFFSSEHHFSENATEKEVLKKIQELNTDTAIHGILVQLPLPKHFNEKQILNSVSPEKDVDGFHLINMGRLMSQDSGFVPCTPRGIMTLLEDYKISLKGKRAVVIGRSRIVGRPMSLLLDHAGATVTVVHSQTQNPEAIIKEADILVAALGKPKFVQAHSVKAGAVVIDVGINRLPDGKIVGDVDFESVSKIASSITPVPGGVGPMTIVSLLENTWQAFEKSCGQ